jgi:hypothetical protein
MILLSVISLNEVHETKSQWGKQDQQSAGFMSKNTQWVSITQACKF